MPIHCTTAKERQPGLDFSKKKTPKLLNYQDQGLHPKLLYAYIS